MKPYMDENVDHPYFGITLRKLSPDRACSGDHRKSGSHKAKNERSPKQTKELGGLEKKGNRV